MRVESVCRRVGPVWPRAVVGWQCAGVVGCRRRSDVVWVGMRVWCVCSGEPRASARAEDCRYAQAGSFPTLALNRCVAYVLGHYPGTLRMGDTRITQAPTHSSGHVWMCVCVRVRRGRMRRRQHCKREKRDTVQRAPLWASWVGWECARTLVTDRRSGVPWRPNLV